MYSRFTFVENTIGNLPNVTRAKFLGSNGLFSFNSICNFNSFKNPFAMITSLYKVGINENSDFYELWQQRKKLKTMEMNEA